MSHTSMVLSGILLLVMVLFFAPNIFAMNRGRILRNMAFWLAIFLGLALVYKNFGPNSPNPLFKNPNSLNGMEKEAKPLDLFPKDQDKKDQKKGVVEQSI